MNYLKDKIENEIKRLKQNRLEYKYSTKEAINIQIETLEWVLKELKKCQCENCKNFKLCEKELYIDYYEKDIKKDLEFCNYFEEII